MVGFENGVGRVSAPLAIHARGGDVHAALAQALRDVRQHAGHVALAHDDARAFAGHVHVDAVDAADDRRPAAHAFAAHAHLVAGGVLHENVDGVGVLIVVGIGQSRESKREPRLFSQLERIAYAQVVGCQSQHAGHERLVGAVPGQSVRERSQQTKLDASRFGKAEPARHERDAQSSRRMGARGSYHDGADDVG